jgi:hypothetical protein
MRREVPLIITAIIGIVFVIQYFVPHPPFNRLGAWFADWFSIVAACAIVLGALNLLLHSAKTAARRKEGWGFALVIIASFFLMVVIGLSDGEAFNESTSGYTWMYNFVYNPLSSTMYAILAFFVASASYRAFRARNTEATLLLASAFLVMLGRVPIGDVMTLWMPEGYRMSDVATWIMDFPQTAGQRAIMIGIALGLVSTALRVILGIERSYLGGGD